jgi:amidohydrolase
MKTVERIHFFLPEMSDWRHDLHAHPEIGFREHRTSQFVADKLESWGIEVTRGIAGTGLVGRLKVGTSGRAIGIRADMDALGMREEGTPAHRSLNENCMHGCGHDGHTTMLLGAAKYLTETRNFDGTVHFIFQPAEEGLGGARKMVSEGLFDRFPCDAVFGAHNDPTLPFGTISLKPGSVSAASVRFWIELKGQGAHASQPHKAIDPVFIGAQIVVGLQSIVSRRLNPNDCGVVSVTQFHAGSAGNVLPAEAVLNGTIRALTPETHAQLKDWLVQIVTGTAATHGAIAEVRFEGDSPPTMNAEEPTKAFVRVASEVLGESNVLLNHPTAMTGEDFAEFALKVPSCFAWVGQADDAHAGNRPLHHPQYDFNNALLPVGASLWARLVEEQLPTAK